MLTPRFAQLAACAHDAPTVTYATGSPTLSANPRLYKYLWQVFSIESRWEADEFFERAPYCCTADMLSETARLLNAGHSCVLYGFARPREGPEAPWDRAHPRWKDAVFAPSWDDDTDAVSTGGHK